METALADFTTTSTASGNIINILALIAIIAVVALGGLYLSQDHRTSGQRIGDAIGALPAGPDKAVDKLHDQSPAANIKRNLKDAAS
jgi:hypothetical protein